VADRIVIRDEQEFRSRPPLSNRRANALDTGSIFLSFVITAHHKRHCAVSSRPFKPGCSASPQMQVRLLPIARRQSLPIVCRISHNALTFWLSHSL
jgi:hypothetical protein